MVFNDAYALFLDDDLVENDRIGYEPNLIESDSYRSFDVGDGAIKL